MMAEEKTLPAQERLLGEKIVIINVGLVVFEESLQRQGLEVVAVQWQPPHPLPQDVASMLKDLL
jgi:hypothetical protein